MRKCRPDIPILKEAKAEYAKLNSSQRVPTTLLPCGDFLRQQPDDGEDEDEEKDNDKSRDEQNDDEDDDGYSVRPLA